MGRFFFGTRKNQAEEGWVPNPVKKGVSHKTLDLITRVLGASRVKDEEKQRVRKDYYCNLFFLFLSAFAFAFPFPILLAPDQVIHSTAP